MGEDLLLPVMEGVPYGLEAARVECGAACFEWATFLEEWQWSLAGEILVAAIPVVEILVEAIPVVEILEEEILEEDVEEILVQEEA